MKRKPKVNDDVAPFGNTTPKYYHVLNADKDYDVKCDFLEMTFREYSLGGPRPTLDCGSGTDGHARFGPLIGVSSKRRRRF